MGPTQFKQHTLEDSHVVSLIPLAISQYGFLDSLQNIPLEPREIENANTLLARVDSVRYQVATFNFGLLTTKPAYNYVTTQLMYLNQLNRHSTSSHPLMRIVTIN